MGETAREFTAGECVTWMYETRAGYGYVIPVRATVVRCTPQRVVIAAEKRDGTTVEKRVKPEKLRKVSDA